MARREFGHTNVKIIPPISTPARARAHVPGGFKVLLRGQADPKSSREGILFGLFLLIVVRMKAVYLKGMHARAQKDQISPTNAIWHMRVTARERDRKPDSGKTQDPILTRLVWTILSKNFVHWGETSWSVTRSHVGGQHHHGGLPGAARNLHATDTIHRVCRLWSIHC